MRIPLHSLNARLILFVSCILIATGAMSGWLTARQQAAMLDASMRRNAELMTRNLGDRCAYYLVLQDFAGLQSFLMRSAGHADIQRLQVCEANGVVVGDVESNSDGTPKRRLGADRIEPPRLRGVATLVENGELVVWQPVEAGDLIGWIRAVYNTAAIHQMKTATWRNSLLLSLFWVVCSSALLVAVFRPLVRDIAGLTAFARNLDEHKGAQTAVNFRAEEIEDLAASLNYASNRLSSSEQDLIHERETLKEQYSTLRGIIDSADALIFSVDRRYRYTSFNTPHASAMRAIYGAEIRIGANLLECMTVPEDREKTKGNLDRALAGERFDESAYSGENARTRLYFEVSHNPIFAGDGKVIGVAVLSWDVTERKRAEDAVRESEQKYHDIFDNVLDGLYLLEVTGDGRFRTLEINPALQRSTGIPREQVIGKTQEETVPPEVAEIVNAKYRHCVEAGYPIEEEAVLELPAGRRYYHSTLIPMRDGVGRVNRIIGISRDITERKLSEENLALLNFALNNVRDEAYLINEEAHFDYVNDQTCRSLGYSRQELLGMGVADVDPDFPGERWPEHWSELKRTRTLLFEGRHRTRDGRIFPVEISANYFEYEGKGYNLALTRDITERKLAEEALRNSESRYRMAQTIGHVGSWEYDLQTTHFWGSDEAKRIYGFEPEQPDFTTKEVESCIPEREWVHQALVDLIERGKPYNLEFSIIPKNSPEPKIIASIAELQRDEHGNPLRVIGVIQDITERKQSEERLLKLSSAIEQSPVSIVITDTTGKIEYVNPKFTQVTGYGSEDVRGKNPRILKSGSTPQEEYRRLWATITAGNVWNGTFCNRKKNGELFWEKETIAPVMNKAGDITHYIAIKEDISEMRRLEEQLRQAQKMEAIGTLAGGIAHDFNNILTAIIGYSNIVKMKMQPDDPQRVSIDQILASSDRAAHLTQGLLAFSRKQLISPRPVDLNDIVRSVEKLLRRIIGEDVVLSTKLSELSLIAMADSIQIEQVLMNFATNARDAMPHGGALTILTQEVVLGEDFVAMHGFGKPGRYALIAVSDTGEGIGEKTREHIFDPFFTTKEPGKGTGLGLAIVYGIVKQHNGNINVYSEPGKGTTFKIYLPLIVTPAEQTEEKPAVAPRGGKETILLAEDEREVRDLTVMILKDYGYAVIEAVDGEDALNKFRERTGEIDLLVLDVIMPHKSGKEAYDAIKALRPDIAALFISGYTADILYKKGISGEGLQFISKPVSPFELLRKIREILDRK